MKSNLSEVMNRNYSFFTEEDKVLALKKYKFDSKLRSSVQITKSFFSIIIALILIFFGLSSFFIIFIFIKSSGAF